MKLLTLCAQLIVTLIQLTYALPVNAESTNKKSTSTQLAPVQIVPLKLGRYKFEQGNKAFADSIINYQVGSPAPSKKYQDPKKALSKPNYKKVETMRD